MGSGGMTWNVENLLREMMIVCQSGIDYQINDQ